MALQPWRGQQALPAQAKTTVETPNEEGLSMRDFYRGIFKKDEHMKGNVFNREKNRAAYDLPKHISNTAGEKGKAYWEYAPKPNACDKCQAMKGLLFTEKPGPIHPNCKCEIRQATMTNVSIMEYCRDMKTTPRKNSARDKKSLSK